MDIAKYLVRRTSTARLAETVTGVVTGIQSEGLLRRITVNVYSTPIVVTKTKGYIPSVNDIVLCERDANGHFVVIAGLNDHVAVAAPPAPPAPSVPIPQPPRPPSERGTTAFRADSSDTYQPGVGWLNDTTELKQGTLGGDGPFKGLWFYKGVPAATMPGYTFDGGRLLVRRALDGGSAGTETFTVLMHGYDERPVGNPTLSGSLGTITLGRGESGWIPVSAEILLLMTRTPYATKGFGIQGEPHVIAAGTGLRGDSGTLIVDWQRPTL